MLEIIHFNPQFKLEIYLGTVVVAQLVERSLPIPEVRGSNHRQFFYLYIEYLFTVNCVLKRQK